MKTRLTFWSFAILPPLFFFLSLLICLISMGANNLTEEQISQKISESIPYILFAAQFGMLVLLLVYLKNKQNIKNIFTQTLTSPQFTKDIFWGVLLGLAIGVSYFYLGLNELVTNLQIRYGDYVPAGDTSNKVSKLSFLFFISNIILAPFVEENIYRNILFKKLKTKYNAFFTVLISALLFGILHWLGGFWYILTTAILIGIPFGLIQLKKESILLVFIAHLTLNTFEFIHSFSF